MNYAQINNILHEYYVEVYRKATPPADYDELVKNAVIDEHGQENIDMDSYVLSEDVMSKIAESYIKKYKLKGIWLETFNFYAWLGPVPRSKPKE